MEGRRRAGYRLQLCAHGYLSGGQGRRQQLELLEHPLRIGHEVFTSGRISVETVRRLSEILRGYSQVMKEYGVTEYRAIATTALREAATAPTWWIS